MFEQIKTVFKSENIQRIGIIDINECDIINQRILPEFSENAIIFCIPYRSTKEPASDGFSEYARVYDYHSFAKDLYSRIIPRLETITGNQFCGFCDHSPINEKLAAAKCGLGVIGRNSLFIDNVYGSYIFLGSLITDLEHKSTVHSVKSCINCEKCVSACPNNAIIAKGINRDLCLSAISQKKYKTESEVKLLKEHNIVWGCDTCQSICPHNENALISPIEYFSKTRIPFIDKDFILSLSDSEFKKYAFAYKGRKIVINNIEFDNFIT